MAGRARSRLVGAAVGALAGLAVAAGVWRAHGALARAGRENRAIERVLRAYRAQTKYYALERGDGVRRYAGTLEELAAKAPEEGGGPDLAAVAGAKDPAHALGGYWFALVGHEAGPDWDGQSFVLAAVPADWPRSGRRTFAIRGVPRAADDPTANRLWARDTGGSAPEAMPARPAEAGWVEVRAAGD